MWKASIGVKPIPAPKPSADDDDDWDTDPNFVNNVSEKESRWGAKTISGSGHQDSVRLDQLRDQVLQSDAKVKQSLTNLPNASAGYGGKFGVESDRVDKCAEGYDYKGKVEPHFSQKDYSKGFGGAYGVQEDRQDKSAVGWTDREALAKHESQKDYAVGFGGKHGVQSDRIDKSAVGWDHHEKLQQHESQKDYKQGFGGQYGVQSDRRDKSAVGWDDHEKLYQHESQSDYKKGFGGQYGVQSDRKDKCAVGWDDHEKLHQHESQIVDRKIDTGANGRNAGAAWQERHNLEKHESQKQAAVPTEKGKASSLRSKFEQLATQDAGDKVREERERRRREDDELRKRQAEAERARQEKIDAEWAQHPQDPTGDGAETSPAPAAEAPAKARPSIGVRLPYSTALDVAPPKPARTSEYIVDGESISPIPSAEQPQQHSPVAAAPAQQAAGAVPSLSALIHRRRPSSDSENGVDEDEWAENANDDAAAPVAPTPQHVPAPAPMAEPAVQESVRSQPQYEVPPIQESAPIPPAPPQPQSAGLTAVALFEYERQDDDEIGFDVNDIITDIEQIDAGWWRGTCRGRFGLFPANYVQLRN